MVLEKERCFATGIFRAKCFDSLGNLLWEDTFGNHIIGAGLVTLLDAGLQLVDNSNGGSAYLLKGPFMGLINATPTISTNDTMASHAGWTEQTNYTISLSAVRPTCSWSASTWSSGTNAASKTLSANPAFVFTSSTLTIAGAFIVFGYGNSGAAVSTLGDSHGSLYSAGTFTGGNKLVNSGDTLNVTYTTTLTTS